MFLHAGLWKSSTGCHIGEIQRPERWLQMHREDEWQMVSQHKQLSPLCFWSGDVSGVLKWKFGLLAFVSLTSLYYVFIHCFSSEMLWKISPPFRIDFSLKSFAIRIKIRVTLVIVRVCLRKTRWLYIKESWIDLFWWLLFSFSYLAGLVGGKSMLAKMMAPLTILWSVITMQRCQGWIDSAKSWKSPHRG
jgi:hypothetical protein